MEYVNKKKSKNKNKNKLSLINKFLYTNLCIARLEHSLPREVQPYSSKRELAWVNAITTVRRGVPCVLTGGEKSPSKKDLRRREKRRSEGRSERRRERGWRR